jgi:hypothetical protein
MLPGAGHLTRCHRFEAQLAQLLVLLDLVALSDGERRHLREAVARWRGAEPGPPGEKQRAALRNAVLVAVRPPPAQVRALAEEGLSPLSGERLKELRAVALELGALAAEPVAPKKRRPGRAT